MRTTLAGLVTGLLLAVGLVAAPATAAPTEWQSPYSPAWDDQNATLQVASFAELKKKGFAVNLDVRFTCPKGERYTIDSQIQEINPPREPVLDGDAGIRAYLDRTPTGKCTGKAQVETLRYTVRAFNVGEYQAHCWPIWVWDDATQTGSYVGEKCYTEGDYLVPILPTGVDGSSRRGEPFVRLSGRNFQATYDAWEASCCGNGSNVGFR